LVNLRGVNMSEKSSPMGKDFILFASKASRLMKDKKTKQALNLCEAGVRKFPFYASGHFVLGLCYEEVDKKEDAKHEFERTLVYDPAHLKAMRKISDFYQETGLQQIADEWLVKEALYNPLDNALISTLKEKNIYTLLNPVQEEESLVETDTAEDEQTETISVEKLLDGEKINTEANDTAESILEQDAESIVEEDAQSLIEELDPLTEDYSKTEQEAEDDLFEEEIEESKDLDQFANMEDDFSTIINGYFDKDESSTEKEQTEGDEWIEVENLLLDEDKAEETDKNVLELDSSKTDEDIDPVNGKKRDDTELLLEQLSDLESGQEETNETGMSETGEEKGAPETIPEENNEPEVEEPQHEEETQFIPPVIESTTEPEPTADDEVTIKDLMENPNLMTPTFGEILVSQHKFAEARHIFSELLKKEPDNTRFIKKIEFLDKFLEAKKA
jgi:tetratricopeptide (TPR) repeat protein